MSALTWDDHVLRYNLYDGDKDDGGVRVLRDRIVVARASGPCSICYTPIVPGTRIRVETGVVDGRKMASVRTCHACCDAMARAWKDDGVALDRRYAIGERRRNLDLPRLDTVECP